MNNKESDNYVDVSLNIKLGNDESKESIIIKEYISQENEIFNKAEAKGGIIFHNLKDGHKDYKLPTIKDGFDVNKYNHKPKPKEYLDSVPRKSEHKKANEYHESASRKSDIKKVKGHHELISTNGDYRKGIVAYEGGTIATQYDCNSIIDGSLLNDQFEWPPYGGCINIYGIDDIRSYYRITRVHVGTILDRFGGSWGGFFGTPSNSYVSRSIPYISSYKTYTEIALAQVTNNLKDLGKVYHKYKVIKPIHMFTCRASPIITANLKGAMNTCLLRSGGATQYVIYKNKSGGHGTIRDKIDFTQTISVDTLLKTGYLEEILVTNASDFPHWIGPRESVGPHAGGRKKTRKHKMKRSLFKKMKRRTLKK